MPGSSKRRVAMHGSVSRCWKHLEVQHVHKFGRQGMQAQSFVIKSVLITAGLFILTIPSFADRDRRDGHRAEQERARRYDDAHRQRYADDRYERYRESDRSKRRYEAGRSGLPPGLANRRNLPPGLEKQLRRNGQLPPGLENKTGRDSRYDDGRRYRGRR